MTRAISLVVASTEAAGPGIVRLRLQDPDGWELPRWKPGAHLDLHVPGVGPRSYSLCGDPAVRGAWDVAVKREAASRGGGTWLHALQPGDPVDAAMPRCTFPIAPGAAAHVMVAGGIGVTPFLAMAHELARQGADWSLHALYRRAPPCPDDLARWQAGGRVTLHDTARYPRPGWDELLGQPGEGRHAYCCGPTPMLEAFGRATAAWPPGTAHVEYFVPPPVLPSADARPYTVRRAATGAEATVPAGGSLLTALRALGATVDASCEGGICGACEVPWTEGEPIHRDRVLSPERRRTHLMACVAQCASERLTVNA